MTLTDGLLMELIEPVAGAARAGHVTVQPYNRNFGPAPLGHHHLPSPSTCPLPPPCSFSTICVPQNGGMVLLTISAANNLPPAFARGKFPFSVDVSGTDNVGDVKRKIAEKVPKVRSYCLSSLTSVSPRENFIVLPVSPKALLEVREEGTF